MVSLMKSGTLIKANNGTVATLLLLLSWKQETQAEWHNIIRKTCGNDVGRKTFSDPKSNTICGISKHSLSQTDQLSQQHRYEN